MYNFIDLFAGLSGIRIGFEQAAKEMGLRTKCVLTSEIKPAAIEALRHRYPTENVIIIFTMSMRIYFRMEQM